MVKTYKDKLSIYDVPLATASDRPDLYVKSRVKGDFQAQFCERL